MSRLRLNRGVWVSSFLLVLMMSELLLNINLLRLLIRPIHVRAILVLCVCC